MNVHFNDVVPGMLLCRNWRPRATYFLVIAITNDELWYVTMNHVSGVRMESVQSWYSDEPQFTHIDQIIRAPDRSQ